MQIMEGEYSVVLKAIEKAVNEKDEENTAILKRALLYLEKRGSMESDLESTSSQSTVISPYDTMPSDVDEYTPSEKNMVEKLISQNIKQYDALMNIMLVGERMTGKTTFIHTLVNSIAPKAPRKTSG